MFAILKSSLDLTGWERIPYLFLSQMSNSWHLKRKQRWLGIYKPHCRYSPGKSTGFGKFGRDLLKEFLYKVDLSGFSFNWEKIFFGGERWKIVYLIHKVFTSIKMNTLK